MSDTTSPAAATSSGSPTGSTGPVAPAVVGSTIFRDATDNNVLWYVPTVTVSDPDAAFGFAVVQTVGATGDVFNQANLTLSVRLGEPAETAQARTQFPGASFQQVDVAFTDVELLVPFTDANGVNQTTPLKGKAGPSGDSPQLVFACTGAAVIQAYLSLVQLGGSQLQLGFSYQIASPDDTHATAQSDPCAPQEQAVANLLSLLDDPDVLPSVKLHERASLAQAEARLQACRRANARPGPVTQGQKMAFALATTYGGALYGSRYTITIGSITRIIVDSQDLTQFEPARHRYAPIEDLSTDDYSVFFAPKLANTYLLVPRRYRVGRAGPGLPGVQESSPLIRWVQEFDATHDATLPCRLQANLQPDIDGAARANLLATLTARTPHAVLILPTSPNSGLTHLIVTEWNAKSAIQTSLNGDTVQLGADLTFADAVILNGMLTARATEELLVGNATFAFDDGSTLGDVELHVDITRLAGPWPADPVTVTSVGTPQVTITNHSESLATVTQVLASLPAGDLQVLASDVNLTVAAGTSIVTAITALAPSGAPLIAAYTLSDAAPAVVDEQRVYLEDLHTTVTIYDDVTMAQAGISSVEVVAHLDSDVQPFHIRLVPGEATFQFDLVQPLVADRQASAGLLHLSATRHTPGQPDLHTGDFVADLHKGVLIQLSAILAAT